MSKRQTKRATAKRREQQRKARSVSVGHVEKFVRQELAKKDAAIPRAVGRPKGSTAFQRVQRAKEILAQSAPIAARLITKAAKIAALKGDSAPAEFLLKHVGAQDDQGKLVRPVITSVDKLEGEGSSRLPTINIGWIPAGRSPAALPPAVDAEVISEST